MAAMDRQEREPRRACRQPKRSKAWGLLGEYESGGELFEGDCVAGARRGRLRTTIFDGSTLVTRRRPGTLWENDRDGSRADVALQLRPVTNVSVGGGANWSGSTIAPGEFAVTPR